MMVTLVCAVAAISLAIAGLRALQKNGLKRGEAGASLLCAACGIAQWPTSAALATDRLFGVPGLAHVLADSLILLTFTLQFRFTRVLSNAWTRRMKMLFYGAIGLIALHAALWVFDEMTVPGDHRTLWYNHYYGQPPQLVLTYLSLVAGIVWCASCCVYGYLPSLRKTQVRNERLTAAGIIVIAVGAIIYAVLIAVQVVISTAGGDAATVTRYTVPLMIICALVALAVAVTVLFGRRAWWVLGATFADRRTLERIRLEAEHLERMQSNMVNLAIAIDDRLLRVRQDYAAAAAVEAVTNTCTERNIPPPQRKVAREAVRIVTLSYDNVSEPPFFDSDELAERKGVAEYYLLQADGSYFFDDVYRVAFLAVGGGTLLAPDDLPEEIEFQDWHRDLAAIVAGALRDYYGRNDEWSA